MIKKIQFLIIVIGVLMIIGKNAFSEWKGCIYDYAITGEETYIPVIIGKFCGPGAPTELVIEKLDLSTGVYDTIVVLHNAPKWYPEAVSFPANIAIFDNNGAGLSFDVVSLSTMKVIGKITVDVQSSGDNLCQIQGESSALISPDGTRVAIPYIPNEQKDCTQAIAIYDLKTYKLINTLYNIKLDRFSSDGKFLYGAATPIENYLYIINPSDGKILSKLDLHSIDPTIYRGAKGVSGWWYVEDGKLIKIGLQTNFKGNMPFSDRTSITFLYNPETKATTPTITTDWYWDVSEGRPGLPDLSPGAKWWIVEPHEVVLDSTSAISASNCLGKVDVYEVATGNKVAEMNITLPAYPLGVMGPYSTNNGKTVTQYSTGAIISWANDHTFIYNTTQKLIYFDILKNKIIKELPIIRPWEKKGWKPEVGK